MTPISSLRRPHRHLLLGSAGAALAAMLAASPSQAQVAAVTASGERALVTDQANRQAPTLADGGATVVQAVIAGPAQDARTDVSDNALSITARGNRAINSLVLDALVPTIDDLATHLTAGRDGVTGDTNTLIASSQRNIGSPVEALQLAPRISLDAASVSASQLNVSGNAQEGAARGNDGVNTLALTGLDSGAGAGIVSLQTGDALSSVAARSHGVTILSAHYVDTSDLALTGNAARAFGYGNAVDNALSVKALSVAAPSNGAIAAIVPAAAAGDPAVDAGYAVLSTQDTGGAVKARTGDLGGSATFRVTVGNNLVASSLENDSNDAAAFAYGNQSANGLDLEAATIAAAPGFGGLGSIANVTGVQRIEDSRVIASSSGGAVSSLLGNVADSSLSSSLNRVRTTATGNRADGNLLSVKSDGIDEPAGLPGGGYVGTALVANDGTVSTSAAVSVLNAQDFGRGTIAATQTGPAVRMQAVRDVRGSSLLADGNVALGAGTGNSAVNGATIAATLLRGSADVANFQTGDGSVLVGLGLATDRGGVIVEPRQALSDSTVSVTNNSGIGTAIGNVATSSLGVKAVQIADGSGHDDAEAGPLSDGYGAAATFALANNQKLGEPSIDGSLTAHVTSSVYGGFGVAGAGVVDSSSLAIDGNLQRANALGSTAVNRLTLSAVRLDGSGAPAPGTALSSSQYGEADISASSDMDLITKASLTASSTSLSGNGNQALAAVNDVDNGLTVDAVGIDSATGGDAHVLVGSLGSAAAIGDHVLSNAQFATGSADATAHTSLANQSYGTGLDASRFTIADNATSADASANRALNTVAVTAGSTREANAALANSQMSVADVTSSAFTNAAYVFGVAPGASVSDSTLAMDGNSTTALARGNVADNQLVLSGAGGTSHRRVAQAETGRFDASADAAAALLNGQTNYGTVTASADMSSYGVPLNLTNAPITSSNLTVPRNSASANAYGNIANNLVTVSAIGAVPTAAVVNVQANYAPVTAQTVGATYRIVTGTLSASGLAITGNQLLASATGNQAVNTVTTPR